MPLLVTLSFGAFASLISLTKSALLSARQFFGGVCTSEGYARALMLEFCLGQDKQVFNGVVCAFVLVSSAWDMNMRTC